MTCPRCRARMVPGGDKYGRFYACIFCGCNIDIGPDGVRLVPLPRANDVKLPIKRPALVR